MIKGFFNDISDSVNDNETTRDIQLREHMRGMKQDEKEGHQKLVNYSATVKSTRHRVETLEASLKRDNDAGLKLKAQHEDAEKCNDTFVVEAIRRKMDTLSSQMTTKEIDLKAQRELLTVQEENLSKMQISLNKVKSNIRTAENRQKNLEGRQAVVNAQKESVQLKGIDNQMSRFNELLDNQENSLRNDEFRIEAAEELATEEVDVDEILREDNQEKSAKNRWS